MAWIKGVAAAVVVLVMGGAAGRASVLTNVDFEAGNLDGWTATASQLTIAARTNDSYNRYYSAAMTGRYTSATWITNRLRQDFSYTKGDPFAIEGFVKWHTYTETDAAATGYVEAVFLGDNAPTQAAFRQAWSTTNSWTYFKLHAPSNSTLNSGFEEPNLTNWAIINDHLVAFDQTNVFAAGQRSMRVVGSWTNWSFNQTFQAIHLQPGDVVDAKARMRVDLLSSSGDWAVSGIKVERDGGGQGAEHVVQKGYNTFGQFTNMSISMVCTQAGTYIYRTMICGGANGTSQADVYFDDVTIRASGTMQTASIELRYIGHSGSAMATSSVAVYFDALTLRGAAGTVMNPTNILTSLDGEAQTYGTTTSAIPKLVYPTNGAYGTPVGVYPASVEVPMDISFTNVAQTSNIPFFIRFTIYPEEGQGDGYIEFDRFQFLAKDPHYGRNMDGVFHTNAPYFVLGTDDNKSTEFGNGGAGDTLWFTLGDPLSNFPKRMSTQSGDPWPSQINIWVPNFSQAGYTSSLMDLHFVVDAIATNGSALGIKNGNIAMDFPNVGGQSKFILSSKLHMGWAMPEQSAGMIDYPNVTYQDHNAAALRAPWIHNIVDDGTGWFLQQAPRGGATIEPMDLYGGDDKGNWIQRTYDEALFLWQNAASGVKSIFDKDTVEKLAGPARMHTGLKVGHFFVDPITGGSGYPEIVQIRGNGYFRMTDYNGVMAGSFRPVASDIFGLYKGYEDFPLLPKLYSRIVAKTTTNAFDNSYAQIIGLFRSNTNQAFAGTVKADLHFTQSEATNGTYFDMSVNTWSKKAHTWTNAGPLALFSQVSMNWRGRPDINNYSEGHDLDAVMVKKSDGEWVSHQVLNPPTNVYYRRMTEVKSNDVIYIMQQDRASGSYGHTTEAPYRKASSFEITILNDGGLPLDAALYESHTKNEYEDNVNITVNIMTNFTAGQKVSYGYRYLTTYAPGVFILNPNETVGGSNWSNDVYGIEFIASDGEDYPLNVDLFYGTGKDAAWVQITTNGPVVVTSTNNQARYNWNTAGVATGAYYIKAVVQRQVGGHQGFDVSNTRLQVGPVKALPNNALSTAGVVVTNPVAYMGTNTGFELSPGESPLGWAWTPDSMDPQVVDDIVFEGQKAARLVQRRAWTNWQFNSIWQDVPCVAGDTITVKARVLHKNLGNLGTNGTLCGIKMESTNGTGGAEALVTSLQPANTWITCTVARTAAYTGAERLHLWCAGPHGSNAQVYFDQIEVTTTNINLGRVVTNAGFGRYWASAADLDVSGDKMLTLFVCGTNNTSDLRIWASDAASVTNAVVATNYIKRLGTVAQRADIPWSHFPGINKATLRSVGYYLANTNNDLKLDRALSQTQPFIVKSALQAPPRTDYDGMPLYNPGHIVTNILTISNLTASAMTGLTVQVVQEYGQDAAWQEGGGYGDFTQRRQQRGDRLCGQFEQKFTNLTIPAGGMLTLTNRYAMPRGKTVLQGSNTTWLTEINYPGKAQVHVAVRKTATGEALYDNDSAGAYSMSPTTNMAFTAPVAQTLTFTNLEDQAVYLEAKATDADGDPVKYIVVSELTHTNSWRDPFFLLPKIWYNVGPNWNGTNSMTYQATDGRLTSAVATLTFVTVPVDDAPVANDQYLTNNEDTAKAITLTGYDIDTTGTLAFVVKTQPANGSVSGTVPNVTYRPNTNYAGLDSFTFCAVHGGKTSTPATITITNIAVNDAPVASNQSVSVTEDVAKVITLGGHDVDSTNLTRQIVANPTKGVLSGTGTNRTYTPNANQNGADSFTFTITDGTLTSAVATVSITIAAVNDAPVANTQSVFTAKNTAKAITLTATDIDSTNALSYTVVTNPANGVLSGTAPNLTYTPNNNWTGVDSLSFKASDGSATSLAARVTITVTNSPSTIYVDDSNAGMENGTQANPYNTIMEAVNVALAGDTVMVNTGFYGEVVVLSSKANLTLRGASEQAVLTNSPWKITVLNSQNCTIEGFMITGGVSGIYIAQSTNITIARNTLKNLGAYNTYTNQPIHALNSKVVVADNILRDNYGGQLGGGGYFGNSHVLYESNDVINCYAWNSAGGVYVGTYGGSYTNRIRQNYFKGCTSDYSGAIHISVDGVGSSTMVDHNTVIASGPDFKRGGAVQVRHITNGGTNKVQVVNNIITDTPRPCCDGLFVVGLYVETGGVYAANNIFTGGNWGYHVYVHTNTPGNVVVEYNDQNMWSSSLYNVTNGVGNITNSPSFTNPGVEDFTLQTNSPCINAGNPAAYYNDANGTRNDMGIYGGNY